MSGPQNELPKGDGTYATHIPLPHALDESMEIIVAYKQNGQYLHPDHGFPARCIIPGWIAGRMVKWLAEIKVSDKESDNYYHYYDNKVWYSCLPDIFIAKRSCCRCALMHKYCSEQR